MSSEYLVGLVIVSIFRLLKTEWLFCWQGQRSKIKTGQLRRQVFILQIITGGENHELSRQAFRFQYPDALLRDPENAAVCLASFLESGDMDLFQEGLRHVAKAHDGGAKGVAESAQLSRVNLYKALSKKRKPELETVYKTLAAMGLQFLEYCGGNSKLIKSCAAWLDARNTVQAARSSLSRASCENAPPGSAFTGLPSLITRHQGA